MSEIVCIEYGSDNVFVARDTLATRKCGSCSATWTPEKENQYREDFIDLMMKTHTRFSLRSNIVELINEGYIFKNELSIYIEARKKAQEEIDKLNNKITNLERNRMFWVDEVIRLKENKL